MSANVGKTQKLQEDEVRPKKKIKRGARGKGAAERQRVAHDSSYRETSAIRRDPDINVRCPEGDSDSDGGTWSVSPFCLPLLKVQDDLSTSN